jgi:hypothetical protein
MRLSSRLQNLKRGVTTWEHSRKALIKSPSIPSGLKQTQIPFGNDKAFAARLNAPFQNQHLIRASPGKFLDGAQCRAFSPCMFCHLEPGPSAQAGYVVGPLALGGYCTAIRNLL